MGFFKEMKKRKGKTQLEKAAKGSAKMFPILQINHQVTA